MDYQVTCPKCRANIGIMAVQVGQPIRCPHCRAHFAVANPAERDPTIPLGRVFSFRCSLCHCRLEAYTGMVGQRGQCPTCAAEFRVPPPDADTVRTGGTQPQAQYAQPVHAYAAAGDRAPQIVRLDDGRQAIRCPRCQTVNDVTRNNCTSCAAPFTLEGAEQCPPAHSGTNFGLVSLILGLICTVAAPTVVPVILAVVFGILALREPNPAGATRWQPIVGITVAVLSAIGWTAYCLSR